MKSITNYIIALLLATPFCVQSTHIIGGTATYTSLGIEDGIADIEIYFYLYRDGDSPAQFDDSINIGVYGYLDGEYEFISSQTVALITSHKINFDNFGECSFGMFNYQEGLYAYKAEVPIEDFEYLTFAYQRCCRESSISNLLFPSETGMAISMDIYPSALQTTNQVFSFDNGFPVHVEPGQTTEFDVSTGGAFDKKYYLSTPKAAGGIVGSIEPGDPTECDGIIPDPQICLPGFEDVIYIDPEQPYGEGAELELDQSSGILSINIPTVSKVLVGMTMERYIDDQIVSKLRQQFIISSFYCSTTKTHNAKSDDFAVWPVPATENVLFSEPLKNVSLYNNLGEEQSLEINIEFTHHFNISQFNNGIYYLKGQKTDGKWILKKIIKV